MKKIKFSHDYWKIKSANVENGQSVLLLAVFKTTKEEMGRGFIEYDTSYHNGAEDGHYPLPSGELLVLLFTSTSNRLFTTIRSNKKHPYDKEAYYRGSIGELFKVVIEEGKA